MRIRKKDLKQRIGELEYILSNIPDLLIRIDPTGKVTFINAASVVFFDKQPGQLTGAAIEDIIQNEGLYPLDMETIKRVFDSRQAEIIEGEHQPKTGAYRSIEIRILPEPPALSPAPHVLLMIRDITLRKRAERKLLKAKQKAEESDLLKSAFLANMSHEIRTPLNAIVGFSQIILDETLPIEERDRFYEYIDQNSNQLITLVNDIIDLSKLESNQLVIRDSPVNLNQLLEEMRNLAENEKKVKEKEHLLILLDKELSDSESIVLTDPYRLKQIFTNLLVNTIKFTPKGYIQFGYTIQDEKTLLFYVRDTGIGIPADKQEDIFNYFKQVENSLNRANTGTGLGLSICRKLTDLMHGNIWVHSEPGKGTAFFFTLPFKKA